MRPLSTRTTSGGVRSGTPVEAKPSGSAYQSCQPW
jgi:hypothetical protein